MAMVVPSNRQCHTDREEESNVRVSIGCQLCYSSHYFSILFPMITSFLVGSEGMLCVDASAKVLLRNAIQVRLVARMHVRLGGLEPSAA
jgi:hypothetical protein